MFIIGKGFQKSSIRMFGRKTVKDYIEEYVEINGIKQYFLHYPRVSEYVILYLHGGPGQSEAQFAYRAKDDRLDCSVVYYDQRGTGKTQLKNRTAPENVTTELLTEDLKQTILYLKNRYRTENIILLGHSWGSVLGTGYIKRYPHDVLCFIGTGQTVDIMANEKAAFGELERRIREKGKPKDIKALSKFEGYPYDIRKDEFIKKLMEFRKLQGKYGVTGDGKKQVSAFMKSPVFRLSDLAAMSSAMKVNKNLMKDLLSFSLLGDQKFDIPVFVICGRNDWQTPYPLAEEFIAKTRAPLKELYWVEDAGHLAMLDNPKGYNDALLMILNKLRAWSCSEGNAETPRSEA
jgi:pimeloyl-ACP methyl ester carboxylesterase